MCNVCISAASGFISAVYSISRSFVVLMVLYAFCFSAVKVNRKTTAKIEKFKLKIHVV